MARLEISVQLYTVRSLLEMGMLPLCSKVKEIGFDFVELAGFGGLSASELRRGFDDMGLRISGSHVGEEVFHSPRKIVDEHLELGCYDIAVAWLPENYRMDKESFERTAGLLQEASHNFADEGIRLSYHNHDFEFMKICNQTGWELLFEQSSAICAQVDVYWVTKAGFNPIEILEKVRARVFSIHAKDMDSKDQFCEVGSGILDWSKILDKCFEVGVKTLVIENDEPQIPPLDSIQKSFEFLQAAVSKLN